jgi:hypothetical protein
MREIGCRAFVLKLPKSKNPKIFNRAIECVMIGYSPSLTDTYRCYDRKTGRVHLTRNVDFIESQDEAVRPLTAAQTVKKVAERTPVDGSLNVPASIPRADLPPGFDPYEPSESEEEHEEDAPEPIVEAPRPTRI